MGFFGVKLLPHFVTIYSFWQSTVLSKDRTDAIQIILDIIIYLIFTYIYNIFIIKINF